MHTITKLGAGLTVAATAAACLTATPAYATDYSFSVTHKHANGTVAIRTYGDIDWHNRSVSLRNITLWVRAGECGRAGFFGFSGGGTDYKTTSQRCAGSSNQTFTNIPDITLDGSDIYGGLRYIDISAQDDSHNGLTLNTYER